jgi:hypothetical protein
VQKISEAKRQAIIACRHRTQADNAQINGVSVGLVNSVLKEWRNGGRPANPPAARSSSKVPANLPAPSPVSTLTPEAQYRATRSALIDASIGAETPAERLAADIAVVRFEDEEFDELMARGDDLWDAVSSHWPFLLGLLATPKTMAQLALLNAGFDQQKAGEWRAAAEKLLVDALEILRVGEGAA